MAPRPPRSSSCGDAALGAQARPSLTLPSPPVAEDCADPQPGTVDGCCRPCYKAAVRWRLLPGGTADDHHLPNANADDQIPTDSDRDRVSHFTRVIPDCRPGDRHGDADDLLDNLNEQLVRELITFMIEDPRTISRATRLVLVSRYLERFGDHATNIGEVVVFMVEGRNIRHAKKLGKIPS